MTSKTVSRSVAAIPFETVSLREAAATAAADHVAAATAAAQYEEMLAAANAMIANRFPQLATLREAAATAAAQYEQSAAILRQETLVVYLQHPENKTYLDGAAIVAEMPDVIEVNAEKALVWAVQNGKYTKVALDLPALKADIKSKKVKVPARIATVKSRLDVRITPAKLLPFISFHESCDESVNEP